MSCKYGDQNLDMQERAIERYAREKGLELIMYVVKIFSRKEKRVELEHAMKAATNGDLFVVYKLDRLARSTKELFKLTGDLNKKGVEFVSINDVFDTTTPTGKAMFSCVCRI